MSFWNSLKNRLKAAFESDVSFESRWLVSVDDIRVICKRPNGTIDSLEWSDLKLVGIETTDEGPAAADVFWYLIGEESGCLIPLGATGENALINKLQALPGFNNEAFAEAMSCTSNCKFVCWQRS